MYRLNTNTDSPRGIVLQALIVLFASLALSLVFNAARPQGIPLVAAVPYDIFATCLDSEQQVPAPTGEELAHITRQEELVIVDSRPAPLYERGHIALAISVPFSVLFGASEPGLAPLRQAVGTCKSATIIVYGIADGVDLAAPLAAQLKEIGLQRVHPITGGLQAMLESGFSMEEVDR